MVTWIAASDHLAQKITPEQTAYAGQSRRVTELESSIVSDWTTDTCSEDTPRCDK